MNTEQEIRLDILLDIYFYKKELMAPNLKTEDIDRINESIKNAEELFKSFG